MHASLWRSDEQAAQCTDHTKRRCQRAEFLAVAKVTEIPAGTIKVVTGKGQEILLAKVEGTLRAMNRRCEQRGGSHGGNNQCPA
jgi:hypothetical protein